MTIAPGARCFALVPCAGEGARLGAGLPKQYLRLAGRAMVAHTLDALARVPRITATLVVLAPLDDQFDSHVPDFGGEGRWLARCGGTSRAGTVANGLAVLATQGVEDRDWVLVHDAARCLIAPAQIDALLDACLGDEVGGLLALPLPDTLKAAHAGRVASTLTRSDKWLAQTPQMFRIGSLVDALQLAGDAVTDESSAIEAMGLAPKLVPGSAQNFKVTYPEDFALAQAVLQSRQINQVDA